MRFYARRLQCLLSVKKKKRKKNISKEKGRRKSLIVRNGREEPLSVELYCLASPAELTGIPLLTFLSLERELPFCQKSISDSYIFFFITLLGFILFYNNSLEIEIYTNKLIYDVYIYYRYIVWIYLLYTFEISTINFCNYNFFNHLILFTLNSFWKEVLIVVFFLNKKKQEFGFLCKKTIILFFL